MNKKSELMSLLKYLIYPHDLTTTQWTRENIPTHLRGLVGRLKTQDISHIRVECHSRQREYNALVNVLVQLSTGHLLVFHRKGEVFIYLKRDGYGLGYTVGHYSVVTKTINLKNLMHVLRSDCYESQRNSKLLKKYIRGRATLNQLHMLTFLEGGVEIELGD